MDSLEKLTPDFIDYLLHNKPINYKSNFGLISETSFNSNSALFISILLPFYIKNNYNVIFISCYESLIHYTSIIRKLGLNILQSQSLFYIDSFYSPYKNKLQVELPLSEDYPYTFNSIRTRNYYQLNDIVGIGDLIKGKINEKIDKTKKTIILIDSLSCLPIENIEKYVNDILLICVTYSFDMIAGFNSSLSNNEIDYNLLKHKSSFEVEFMENESGISKDSDGRIKIKYETLNGNNSLNLIFKVKENTIDFFQYLKIS